MQKHRVSVSRGQAATRRETLPPPAAPGTLCGVSTILVVEDELGIARVVQDYLEAAGFTVLLASTAGDAIAQARVNAPDLVVLDLGLPDRDGFDVTRELRLFTDVPIVMLTARGDESDRIVGLELGADDYVVKPFSPKELVARVRAVLRRAETATMPADRLTALDVVVDLPRRRVTVGGRQVELTATEFTLLQTLVREPGRVFTRGQLLDAVHGISFESYERAIDAHVKNLRRKVEPQPGSPRYIQTVHGVGYRFADV
jgi:two-component system, OmpR family, alkaline phosphatase synthesis response regulator PhoP